MNPTLYSAIFLAVVAAAPPAAPGSQITAAPKFDSGHHYGNPVHTADDHREDNQHHSWRSDLSWDGKSWHDHHRSKHHSWSSDLSWDGKNWHDDHPRTRDHSWSSISWDDKSWHDHHKTRHHSWNSDLPWSAHSWSEHPWSEHPWSEHPWSGHPGFSGHYPTRHHASNTAETKATSTAQPTNTD